MGGAAHCHTRHTIDTDSNLHGGTSAAFWMGWTTAVTAVSKVERQIAAIHSVLPHSVPIGGDNEPATRDANTRSPQHHHHHHPLLAETLQHVETLHNCPSIGCGGDLGFSWSLPSQGVKGKTNLMETLPIISPIQRRATVASPPAYFRPSFLFVLRATQKEQSSVTIAPHFVSASLEN
eukprot:gene12384-8510_t